MLKINKETNKHQPISSHSFHLILFCLYPAIHTEVSRPVSKSIYITKATENMGKY